MGSLNGVRIIEFAGIGPGPFAGMMLADQGADVIRIDRAGSGASAVDPSTDVLNRGKRSIALDLKSTADRAIALELIASADGLIEGFRPGVMERLGLGPDECLAANPRLAYGRMTGWGQDGPLAARAGHDINYISITGALHAIGPRDGAPVPPLNVVGDFGGGGMLLAYGLTCAIISARATGKGQVIDAAIVDGTASLMAMMYSRMGSNGWRDQRGSNLLDGGAAHYGTYRCADGQWISLGALEPQFFAAFTEAAKIDNAAYGDRNDPTQWERQRKILEALFARQARAYWEQCLQDIDSCFAPVLSMQDAPKHPHNQARELFFEDYGVVQPSPSPRFSATPARRPARPPVPGQHTDEILSELRSAKATA